MLAGSFRNLKPEAERWVYEVNVTRQDMVNASLMAWHSTSFLGYEELIFRDPHSLPDPIPVGRVDHTGKLELL